MKMNLLRKLVVFLTIFSILLSSCSTLAGMGLGKKLTVTIVYGSEKQEWLDPLVAAYNASKQVTKEGSLIEVTATPIGSIDAVDQILAGTLQPTVWSPASDIYFPVANDEWRKNHSNDLIGSDAKDLLLSPVVIAMWRPMAEALGWPNKAIGWGDIATMATSDKGWAGYGYPEWGQFKFGHTHPGFSNSGLVAIIAQVYAGAGKQRGLTSDDIKTPAVRDFMAQVQDSIIHYGSSTGFFATRMFANGPSYLSAAVMYENLVANQESKRLAGTSQQMSVVAIYPKEGTFWANHPYAILNAPWVTNEQREAAGLFESYLLDKPQQLKAMDLGFRPADPAIALTAPLDTQHGVDPAQPKTVLEIPKAQVIRDIEALWSQVKKPVDLVIAIDVSGSMAGDKIAAARKSLVQFINLLGDNDRLQVTTFSSQVTTMIPMAEIGPKRADIVRRVSGIIEGGDTTLYDAVLQSYQDLSANGDPKHIRAIVVMTDGNDTASKNSLNDVLAQIGSKSSEGGNAIKMFTIGYGSDADTTVLKTLAEKTGGLEYDSKPETINQVYSDIATFF